MVEAIRPRLEASVLDGVQPVLGGQRLAVQETIRNVGSTPDALLLGSRRRSHRAADDRAIDLESKHQVGQDPSSGTSKEIAAIGTDEVGDDVATRPIAVGELEVIVRLSGRLRVLEPAVKPLLPEQSEQVHPPDATDGAPLRQKIRGQEVTHA